MPKKSAADIKAELTKKAERQPLKASDLLSTGSTMLNLACSGKVTGGFPRGRYIFVVGDSDTGKTFITLTCLAEAANDKRFDDYDLIHDDVEGGAMMDFEKFFGKKAAARIQAPHYERGEAVYSETVEDFYDRIEARQKTGKPFIYVLDSMDGLSSRSEAKTISKQKNARKEGEQEKGSYGDGKAKVNSQRIRRVVSKLRKTGSILIIINQTRDNIGFTARFEPKTRSGGNALKFYARIEMWLSPGGELKRTVMGKQRKQGIFAKVKIKKNNITGRKRVIMVPILYSSGIDDVGGCIDFLIDEGRWSKTGGGKDLQSGKISAPEFDFEGSREKLVRHIEREELETDLRDLVAEVWNEIEAATAVKRKSRYA